MPTLLEKIEADAAARLPLPEGRTAAQELARYKAFLKVETHRLKLLHRAGGGGREVCQARAAIMDLLLRHLWDAARNTLSLHGRKEFPPPALVALGGYGRGELNPHSDVDFMFLHSGQVGAGGRPLPHLAKTVGAILYPLWDIGLKVGHSVRSVDECVRLANADMQSKTSLLEARLIVGAEALFEKFEKAVLAKCVNGHEDKYIAARLEDQTARRAKFGNSACMQEPNIKSGCGGLRDYQNLLWMAWFKYRARSLLELQQREFISVAERKQLDAAYDFLLRVRTELHYHANRPVDVLTKNLQPAVAHNFGYTDRSPSRRLEKFMRQVYTHTRNIYLLTRTLEQRLALSLQPRRLSGLLFRRLLRVAGQPEPARKFHTPIGSLTDCRRRRKEAYRCGSIAPPPPYVGSYEVCEISGLEGQLVDGFRFVDGQIIHGTARVFRDQPRRLMRVFLHAQQRGLQLHPDLAQLIRNQLDLVDRAFLHDEHVRETFLTILNQRGNVAPPLRAMHEVGLLGKYIPEFGKLTCLVQHEFYHQYTADEHTLMCLEQLDRVWEAKEPPRAEYAQLFHSLERPVILYLALLLHDVGKAEGHGYHVALSSRLAMRVARRLALDEATNQTLRRIIENHLQMARISQLRDLGDLAVIRTFAKTVQSPETLAALALHTFADSQATSDKLWNGFKDSLLWTLYRKTMDLLTGGTEFVRAGEKQRESLMDDVRKQMPEPLSEEELRAHFAALGARYSQVHAAPEILDDLLLAHRFLRLQVTEEAGALAPVIQWHNHPDRGCNAVKICTWDRAGLFSKIAGSLSAAGLNILSAQIFTRADGIVLDTFFVTDARTGALATREQRDHFDALLVKVLTHEDVDLRALIARQRTARPLYQSYEGERMPTRIVFDNETSEDRTIIEIETEDRLGLLFAISQTLTGLGLNISAARICTEKGAAIDSFYVNDLDGRKIQEPERQKQIERLLRQSINQVGAAS